MRRGSLSKVISGSLFSDGSQAETATIPGLGGAARALQQKQKARLPKQAGLSAKSLES
jgi:hypothetical protein